MQLEQNSFIIIIIIIISRTHNIADNPQVVCLPTRLFPSPGGHPLIGDHPLDKVGEPAGKLAMRR